VGASQAAALPAGNRAWQIYTGPEIE